MLPVLARKRQALLVQNHHMNRLLLPLEKPSKPMRVEAAEAGRFTSKMWHERDYPKIQILTIEGLLDGTERVDAPPPLNPFAKAQREAKPEKQQEML